MQTFGAKSSSRSVVCEVQKALRMNSGGAEAEAPDLGAISSRAGQACVRALRQEIPRLIHAF